MKILVTGGAGFIGRHLIKELLHQGHQVTSFSRGNYPDLERLGVRCLQGSLSNEEDIKKALKGQDACFHMASKVAMWGEWKDFYASNVTGTQNTINACLENKVKYLVYTSTPSVVFGNQDIKGADESLPYPKEAYGLYGKSKILGEEMILKAAGEKLKTLAIRPHLVFGPGDTNLIPRLVEAARKNRLKVVGNGENLVDVLYIDNAVDAHLKAFKALLEKEQVNGEAFFIGQGPVKLWDFINQILKNQGLPPVKKRVSFRKAYMMGFLIEKLLTLFNKFDIHPPMTRFVSLQLSKSHYYSHKKAEELLGWRPKVSIEEALEKLPLY